MWHAQAQCRLFMFVKIFLTCQILIIRNCILSPLFTLSFSFPLFPFFVSPTPVTQEVVKAKNDDGGIKGVIEMAIASSAKIKEEKLHFINLQVTKLLNDYLDQLCCLVVVWHFLYAHEQTDILNFR